MMLIVVNPSMDYDGEITQSPGTTVTTYRNTSHEPL